MKVAAEDEEYARMMLRFDELEKEELAAGSGDEHDEDEHNEADVDHSLSQLSGDHVLGSLEVVFLSWLFTRDMNAWLPLHYICLEWLLSSKLSIIDQIGVPSKEAIASFKGWICNHWRVTE